MVTATFRFYQVLNEFLPPERRQRSFACRCAQAATVKHMIEALGVPHTEVELVLVNGESVGFERTLLDGDRVAVYPRFESLDISPLLKVRSHPLRVLRFVADVHLGGLARLLRMSGFDTIYDGKLDDGQIAALAAREGRIVLTRDRELLKRRIISHGCYVHARQPALHEVDTEQARRQVPPRAVLLYSRFLGCDGCRRIYWEGSHWRSMRALLAPLLEMTSKS